MNYRIMKSASSDLQYQLIGTCLIHEWFSLLLTSWWWLNQPIWKKLIKFDSKIWGENKHYQLVYNPFGICNPFVKFRNLYPSFRGFQISRVLTSGVEKLPWWWNPPLPAFAACCLASVKGLGFFQLTPGRVDVLLLMGWRTSWGWWDKLPW